jgi:hypothetical protein
MLSVEGIVFEQLCMLLPKLLQATKVAIVTFATMIVSFHSRLLDSMAR